MNKINIVNETGNPIFDNNKSHKIFDTKIKSQYANSLMAIAHYENSDLFYQKAGYYLSLIPYNIITKASNDKRTNIMTSTKYEPITTLLSEDKNFNIENCQKQAESINAQKLLKKMIFDFSLTHNTTIPKYNNIKTDISLISNNSQEYEPKNIYAKLIYNSIDKALEHNKTNINKIISLQKESIDNIQKSEKDIHEFVLQDIYTNILNSPSRETLENIYKEHGDKLSFNEIKQNINNWIQNNNKNNIISLFDNSPCTVFELADYFARCLPKNTKYGNGAIWDKDEVGITFMLKSKNMNIDKYNSLNDEGKSFYSIINNQIVEGTPGTYYINTLIQNNHPDGPMSIYGNVHNNEYGYPSISENERYQLFNKLKYLNENNYDWQTSNYIAIPDEPFKEYVIDPNAISKLGCHDILYNGFTGQIRPEKQKSREYYSNQGYVIIDAITMYERNNKYLNESSGQWKEISKSAYENMCNNKHCLIKNNGFYTSDIIHGDLRPFYIKYNDRYFTSLQRLSYDKNYITQNLESNITRFEPLEKRKKNIMDYLKEFYPQIEKAIAKSGVARFTDDLTYEILSGQNIASTKHYRNGLDGIDGKEFHYTFYTCDINNQFAAKNNINKYDQAAANYINTFMKENTYNQNDLLQMLKKMSFKGNVESLANELYKNRINNNHNYVTIEKLLHENKSSIQVIPPTLQEISTFFVNMNMPIQNKIEKNTEHNKHKENSRSIK